MGAADRSKTANAMDEIKQRFIKAPPRLSCYSTPITPGVELFALEVTNTVAPGKRTEADAAPATELADFIGVEVLDAKHARGA